MGKEKCGLNLFGTLSAKITATTLLLELNAEFFHCLWRRFPPSTPCTASALSTMLQKVTGHFAPAPCFLSCFPLFLWAHKIEYIKVPRAKCRLFNLSLKSPNLRRLPFVKCKWRYRANHLGFHTLRENASERGPTLFQMCIFGINVVEMKTRKI